ncbi:MAG: hypothetical protein ACP5PV_04570 [Methanothrix sp.]
MTSHQSPRDRILWILSNSSGKMERSRLRRCTGMKLADLNPILGEPEREKRIWITSEVISIL